MQNKSILYTALGLMIVLAFLHFLALAFYFYWTVWWFDIVMHTLAGISGGLAAFWFLRPLGNFKAALLAIVSVMIMGVAYEVFEYIYNIPSPGNYWQDTIIDLTCDFIGAIIACIYAIVQIQQPSLGSLDTPRRV